MTVLTGFADECRHGLTEAWCSLCRSQAASQRTREIVRDTPAASMWNHPSQPAGPKCVAAHPSVCPECEAEINAGDIIFLRHSSWMCRESAVLTDDLDQFEKEMDDQRRIDNG